MFDWWVELFLELLDDSLRGGDDAFIAHAKEQSYAGTPESGCNTAAQTRCDFRHVGEFHPDQLFDLDIQADFVSTEKPSGELELGTKVPLPLDFFDETEQVDSEHTCFIW